MVWSHGSQVVLNCGDADLATWQLMGWQQACSHRLICGMSVGKEFKLKYAASAQKFVIPAHAIQTYRFDES